MSNAPRPATWNTRSRNCAGHDRVLGQRMSASPSLAGASVVPHSGHVVGMTNSRSEPSRRSTTGPSTSGMTSPALRITTVSPISTPLRLTSDALCSVAWLDRRAGDLDRLHVGERRDPAGAADVDPDVEQLGGGLLRRVLVGDRPARCARRGAEPALQRHLVDFDHHAVDFVLDVVAVLAPVGDAFGDRVDALHPRGVLGHRQAPRLERPVGVVQRLGAEALGVAEAVADHPQLAPRGDGRVLLPQRAGRAVARIGERRLALRDEAGVEVLEVGEPEEHLAAHLEHLRDREFAWCR